MSETPPREIVDVFAKGSLLPREIEPLLVRSWGIVWGIEIAPSAAERLWQEYRSATAAGFYPLVVSSSRDGAPIADEFEEALPPQEYLRDSMFIDAKEWLEAAARGCLMDGENIIKPDFDTDSGANEPDEFACPSLREKERPWFLVLLPTTSPWSAFAYLGYGGWNAYPTADHHIAVMKYWFDRYGAEPVIVTPDCIEMIVEHPPQTEDACRELALEQFGYTGGDLVDQGYESLGTLARVLRDRRHWFFWWD